MHKYNKWENSHWILPKSVSNVPLEQNLEKPGQSMRPSFRDNIRSHTSLNYTIRSQEPTSSGQHQNNGHVLTGVCKESMVELKRGPRLNLAPATWHRRERKCYLQSCLLITLILTSNKKEMCPNRCPGNWTSKLPISSRRDSNRGELERLKRDRRRWRETASPAIVV